MPPPTESRLRVRYAETDNMGVVYYANYYIWMEVGRVDLCKDLGFNYRDMENHDDVFLAVAESTCRYRIPARFDDAEEPCRAKLAAERVIRLEHAVGAEHEQISKLQIERQLVIARSRKRSERHARQFDLDRAVLALLRPDRIRQP